LSSLREVAIETGQVKRAHRLNGQFFGEGLALLPSGDTGGDRLVQLTWQEGKAFEYHAVNFTSRRNFEYEGQGWGLCYDGVAGLLAMSDGSSVITFRDPDDFSVKRKVATTYDGRLLNGINELECVGDHIYANVFLTDKIVRINSTTGAIDCVVDARGLLTESERRDADVLNGIAFDRESKSFFITGKDWPWLFKVSLETCNAPLTLRCSGWSEYSLLVQAFIMFSLCLGIVCSFFFREHHRHERHETWKGQPVHHTTCSDIAESPT